MVFIELRNIPIIAIDSPTRIETALKISFSNNRESVFSSVKKEIRNDRSKSPIPIGIILL